MITLSRKQLVGEAAPPFSTQIRSRNHGNFLIKIYYDGVQPRAKKVDGW